MTAFKIALAVLLCVVGIVLAVFQVGMACGEPHLLKSDGLISFIVVLLVDAIVFSGGVTLLWEILRKR